jgi:hypothetical protein
MSDWPRSGAPPLPPTPHSPSVLVARAEEAADVLRPVGVAGHLEVQAGRDLAPRALPPSLPRLPLAHLARTEEAANILGPIRIAGQLQNGRDLLPTTTTLTTTPTTTTTLTTTRLTWCTGRQGGRSRRCPQTSRGCRTAGSSDWPRSGAAARPTRS